MRRAILVVSWLLAGCAHAPVHLRQFEKIHDDGSRLIYTVDMFKKESARLNGYWVSFRPDSSTKWCEGSHCNGKMDGVWTWWNPSGAIVEQVLYDRGRVREKRLLAPWWSYPSNRDVGERE